MRTKPPQPGLLRRCDNPNCNELIDSGKYCSIECDRFVAEKCRPCAHCGMIFVIPPCHKDQRFHSKDCCNKSRIKDKNEAATRRRESTNKSRKRIIELQGPSELVIKPWEPKPKVEIMTDGEQAEINKRCHIRAYERMQQPLTSEIARRIGVMV